MSSQGHSAAPVSPAIVFDTLMAYRRSFALKAAIELGIFRAVGEGPGDVATLARQVNASERGTRILCDFLVTNGLLQKENGRYCHTPESAAFLDPASPSCLESISRFLSNPELHDPYKHLAEIVRTGKTVLPGDGAVNPENPVWVEFAQSMAPMMAMVAAPLGQIALEGRTGPMRVLDIAAGHGLFGIALAKQNPQAHVTGLDWAPVLEVALENARKAGVQDQYDMLPGSAFEANFGGPYDIVLLTNFLHHFDQDTCVALLKKVREALKPDGTVVTLEFVPNEDRVSPPIPATFALTMLTATVGGDAYTYDDLAQMHRRAGFSKGVQAHPVLMSPHTALIAKK